MFNLILILGLLTGLYLFLTKFIHAFKASRVRFFLCALSGGLFLVLGELFLVKGYQQFGIEGSYQAINAFGYSFFPP